MLGQRNRQSGKDTELNTDAAPFLVAEWQAWFLRQLVWSFAWSMVRWTASMLELKQEYNT